MRDPLVLLFATVTVICVLCMGAFWPIPIVSWSFAFGGAVGIAGFGLNLSRALKAQKYSLTALRDMHEREEAYNLDVPGAPDDAGAFCMCCGQSYPSNLRVCPHCKSCSR